MHAPHTYNGLALTWLGCWVAHSCRSLVSKSPMADLVSLRNDTTIDSSTRPSQFSTLPRALTCCMKNNHTIYKPCSLSTVFLSYMYTDIKNHGNQWLFKYLSWTQSYAGRSPNSWKGPQNRSAYGDNFQAIPKFYDTGMGDTRTSYDEVGSQPWRRQGTGLTQAVWMPTALVLLPLHAPSSSEARPINCYHFRISLHFRPNELSIKISVLFLLNIPSFQG